VGHHLEPPCAYGIDDFGAFLDIRNLELLLEENRRLLIGGLDDTRYKDMIGRRGRRVQKREKIDRLDWANK
jgi:hypothetical protein